MTDLRKSMKAWPRRAASTGPARLVVILLFAVAGAFLLGSVAQPILQFLYTQFAARLSKAPDKPALGDFHANPVASVIPFALLGALLGSWLGSRVHRGLERIGLSW